MPELSGHERELLLALLANGMATNTELARQLRISPTAARKIRMKLERAGIIRGYRPILDLSILGIQVFSILEIRLLAKGWESGGGMGIQGQLLRHENVMAVYRMPEGHVTHIVVAGFRNLEELDRFLHILQSQYSEYLEIQHTYTFSTKSILKEDPRGVLTKVLLEWEQVQLPRGLEALPAKLPSMEAP
jgi:Lrp/AsnC family leucine-responsive transcriptional regulator